jgi:hypothetical protein
MYYNLAVKKELLKKKASITAGVDNPFTQKILLKNYSRAPRFDYENNLFVYTRQLRISLNYQFGKMDFKNQPRRKKKINNDDAKSGSEGNGQ